MTKKDYELIASAINKVRLANTDIDNMVIEYTYKACLKEVTGQLAVELWADNPRFDKAKFMKACEI